LPLARGLRLPRHWRRLHTRNSCIYGINLGPFLADLAGTLAGTQPCEGRTVERLESNLASVLHVPHVVTFGSARRALRALLMTMGIGDGDEVILPGFTCVVVPQAILQCGARPVYVDIQADYRMNLDALGAALTPRTRAIIAQHTFGFPERISEIVTLARARGIRVIEDCAHVLPGSTHGGTALGAWGDAACFSFGRLKTLSSIWGGAAVTRDGDLGRRLRQTSGEEPPLTRRDNVRIGTRLLLSVLAHHPDLYAFARLVAGLPFGVRRSQRIVTRREPRGKPAGPRLGRLADIQASLLLCQIRELSAISARRASCVRALAERLGGAPIDLPLMWYPFQAANPEEAVRHFQNHQIELRRWGPALTPADCDAAGAGYAWGRCPVAERVGRHCVAVPAMLAGADLERVIRAARLVPGRASSSGRPV
jgi:perosamine synthetase